MISLLLFAEQTTENSVDVSSWEIASVIITAVTAILSLLLTFYVHKQTQKNSKNMENISLEMAKRDDEYKKMQLKLLQREDIKLVYSTVKSCEIYALVIIDNKDKALDNFYYTFIKIQDQFFTFFNTNLAKFSFELGMCPKLVSTENRSKVDKFIKDFRNLFKKVSEISESRSLFEKEIDNVLSLANKILSDSREVLSIIEKELTL